MKRRGRRSVAVAVLAMVASGLLPVASAAAHAALESSTPAANSVLEASPPEIVLDFDEEVETGLADIALFDGNGDEVDLGDARSGADSTVVTAAVPELGDGLYAVIWRVASTDGHVVDGAFSFQVGAAAAGDGQELLDRVGADPGGDPALDGWYGVARFLSLVGAVVLLGSGWWAVQAPVYAVRLRRVRRLLGAGWVAMTLGSFAAVGLFAAQVAGGSPTDAVSPQVWGDAVHTDTGQGLLVRSLVALALGGLLLAIGSSRTTWWRVAAAGSAAVALVTFPASGHPNSLSPRVVWMSVDLVHLGAITVWVGGLVLLALLGRTARAEPDGGRLMARFSLAATVAVPLVVATGVAQAWKLAGGLDDVTATDWGRLLLTKVVIVAVLLAIAGVSRWVLHHEGAGPLGRTLVAEAVLGVVVIGLAAGMVAQSPRATVPSQPFGQTLAASGVIASVTVSPGWVGSNEVHVVITPPGGSLTPVADATARVSMPDQGVPAAPVTLVKEGPNHYSGSVTFPRSGVWNFDLVVQVTVSDSVLLSTTVQIP